MSQGDTYILLTTEDNDKNTYTPSVHTKTRKLSSLLFSFIFITIPTAVVLLLFFFFFSVSSSSSSSTNNAADKLHTPIHNVNNEIYPNCQSSLPVPNTQGMFVNHRQRLLDTGVAGKGDVIVLVGNPQEERTRSDTDILFRQDSSFL